MARIKRKVNRSFVDYWDNQWPDKTIEVMVADSEECEVTYANEEGDEFTVIFRQKKYPAGFTAKW